MLFIHSHATIKIPVDAQRSLVSYQFALPVIQSITLELLLLKYRGLCQSQEAVREQFDIKAQRRSLCLRPGDSDLIHLMIKSKHDLCNRILFLFRQYHFRCSHSISPCESRLYIPQRSYVPRLERVILISARRLFNPRTCHDLMVSCGSVASNGISGITDW